MDVPMRQSSCRNRQDHLRCPRGNVHWAPLDTAHLPCCDATQGPHTMKHCADFHAMLQSIYQAGDALPTSAAAAAVVPHGSWPPPLLLLPPPQWHTHLLPAANLALSPSHVGGLPARYGGSTAGAARPAQLTAASCRPQRRRRTVAAARLG